MQPKKQTQQPIKISYLQPILRTVIIKSSPRTWSGCIFFSSYDSTAEILLLINSISGEHKGVYLKYPLYIFKSSSKPEVEAKLNSKIQLLIKSN
jgi:hypothetical protein